MWYFLKITYSNAKLRHVHIHQQQIESNNKNNIYIKLIYIYIYILPSSLHREKQGASNLVWGRYCDVSHIMLADINKKY